MKKKGSLLIGTIVGAHGLNGNIKAHSYAESLSVFESGGSILVIKAGIFEKNYKIKWVKPHGRRILLSFVGIENRNAAEYLIGSELFVERTVLPELGEGSYYWHDIIGLSVFDSDGQHVGRIASIISTGSNDVFVVKNPDVSDHNETLIPALESVVLAIDLENKTMRVDLPKGL